MEFQSFARALADSGAPAPQGLRTWNRSNPDHRFNIYRNNISISLVEALCANFPVCFQLLGDEFFRAMARLYANKHKPESPLMWKFGVTFPAFLASFPTAESVPYVADVARLEVACLHAYHAEDAAACEPVDFAALDRARLSDVRMNLHPSAQVVRSRFAIASLWAAHNGGSTRIETVDPFVPEDALVTRPRWNVRVALLPEGGAVFVEEISRGETLGAATQRALDADPGFDLAHSLGVLITSGAVRSFGLRRGVSA
ncbi:MAG: putative DNA-binding domain-containing protein [Beijerinckiaceae bacterium]